MLVGLLVTSKKPERASVEMDDFDLKVPDKD